LLANGQAVVDVPPVIGGGVRRVDAERFDSIDGLEHFLDLRPAGHAQQALATGTHVLNGLAGLPRRDRAQDINLRQDGSVVVRRPADKSEDAARRK